MSLLSCEVIERLLDKLMYINLKRADIKIVDRQWSTLNSHIQWILLHGWLGLLGGFTPVYVAQSRWA